MVWIRQRQVRIYCQSEKSGDVSVYIVVGQEKPHNCVQSHQNDALVGSYMFLIYSFMSLFMFPEQGTQ